MKQASLRSLSIDELWSLHEEIAAKLHAKLIAEKKMLERRLRSLKPMGVKLTADSVRRPYPPVSPKFINPDDPSETWAGRGKQPRWLRRQLSSGRRIDDFRIGSSMAA
jgi:DNA-binding protein H-NS